MKILYLQGAVAGGFTQRFGKHVGDKHVGEKHGGEKHGGYKHVIDEELVS